MRLELAERLEDAINGRESLPKPLRPYQREALASLQNWLTVSQENRAHIVQATGLGKTVLYATLARQAIGWRILIIMPTKALVAQTARLISGYAGGMVGHLTTLPDITRSTADRSVVAVYGHEHHAIVLATDAGFHHHRPALIESFRPHLILRDECHWAYTRNTQWGLGRFQDSLILGVSATPDYLGTVQRPGFLERKLESGQCLYADADRCASTHFGACLDTRTVHWGIEQGYLCPLESKRLEIDIDFAGIPIKNTPVGYDYAPQEMNQLLMFRWEDVMRAVVKTYQDPDHGLASRRAISLCPTVDMATKLAEYLRQHGVTAAVVHGETPDDERDRLFAAFEAGDIAHLSSVHILREGWDSPNADTAFILRPVRSYVAYVQGVGRILRQPADRPDKKAIVYDLYGGDEESAPLNANIVFGLQSGTKPIAIERYAGTEGMLVCDGEKFVTREYLHRQYGTQWTKLTDPQKVRRIKARVAYSGKDWLYAIEDIQRWLFRP